MPATLAAGLGTLARRLGFRGASAVGRGLGLAAWALDGRHRRVARRNLEIAFPNLPESRRRSLVRDCFRQAGRTVVEMLWSESLRPSELSRVGRLVGREHLERALAEGRGALLASAHLGNWELMGVWFGLADMPLYVIARELDDSDLEAVVRRLRTRTGNGVIYKNEAVRGALRALRRGDPVVMLIDQNTLRSQATFVPFFGKLAATPRLLARLHMRTRAPVLPFFCLPEDGRYRFVIEPPLDPVDPSDPAAVEKITAAVTASLERHVRACPEAWLWIHDRWRTRPS